MTAFPSGATAVVIIDPYNDFVSPLGKSSPLLLAVSRRVGLKPHVRRVLGAARQAGIAVVYAPHHRYRRGETPPRFPNPTQFLSHRTRSFAANGYGGQFHRHLRPAPGEFVAAEHGTSSGFGGTDLHQHLQDAGVTHLALCGLLTNTCVESTARHAVDLGYHVTVLTDAVSTWSYQDHAAAIEGSYPLIVHRLMTVAEFEDGIATAGGVDAAVSQ